MGLHYDVNSRGDCNTQGNLRRPQPKIYFEVLLVCFLVLLPIDIVIECLVKVKKPLQKPCTINLAQRRIQKDRDQSTDEIENVTVKKTFAGTDQTT